MSCRSCKVQFNNTDGQVERGRKEKTKQNKNWQRGQMGRYKLMLHRFVCVNLKHSEGGREGGEENRQLDNGQV